ncbi:sorbose reductase sou1 [Fusarium sporotrichioides]|uniref:Sorbose reductase sou1 n=1 Tax=Fusarium sporotrichioides TaxID=5514 RepID=A0A395RR59_FUSSP|nr:sorbose reductase sou1 [Fusarium sporotrichioides]
MGYVVDIHIYGFGLFLIYQGLVALVDPKGHSSLRGVKDMKSSGDMASFTPIYMLGVRDISVGIFILAHHHVDNLTAVLTLLAVMGFFKICDAIVLVAVWNENTKTKAVENLAFGVGLLGWLMYLAKN